MAVGAGTTQTFEAFRQAVAPYLAGNAGDVIKVQELLSKLKLDIARFDSTNPIATGCDSQELLLARETLELEGDSVKYFSWHIAFYHSESPHLELKLLI